MCVDDIRTMASAEQQPEHDSRDGERAAQNEATMWKP